MNNLREIFDTIGIHATKNNDPLLWAYYEHYQHLLHNDRDSFVGYGHTVNEETLTVLLKKLILDLAKTNMELRQQLVDKETRKPFLTW